MDTTGFAPLLNVKEWPIERLRDSGNPILQRSIRRLLADLDEATLAAHGSSPFLAAFSSYPASS